MPLLEIGVTQQTAIQFLDYALAQLRFAVEKILTDNGVRRASSNDSQATDLAGLPARALA